MPAVRSAAGPIKVPGCEAPISMGIPSRAMRGLVFGFGHQRDFQGPNKGDALRHYALKYAICVVVASRRPEGDHNSPCWSP